MPVIWPAPFLGARAVSSGVMSLGRLSPFILPIACLAGCGESTPRFHFDAAVDAQVDGNVFNDGGDATLDPDADLGPVVIAVRALDAEGAPLSGVAVSIVGAGGDPGLTDAEGWVDVEFPGAGAHLLRFSDDSIITTFVAAEIDAGSMDAEGPSIRLYPANTLQFLESALARDLDEALGVVLVHVQPDVSGGQTVSLTSGGSYVYGTDGSPTPGATLIADAQADVLFVDVPVGTASPSISTVRADETCAIQDTPGVGWVVEAGAMTRIVARCVTVP
jgi:hypothetical protein